MELRYPLSHKFLDRVIHRVTIPVKNYFADNFAVDLSSLANRLCSYWLWNEAVLWRYYL